MTNDWPSVALVIPQDVVITVPRASAQNLDVKVVYEGPLPAPIAKNAEVAKVIINAKDLPPIVLQLHAQNEVGRLGFIGRLKAAAQYIFLGPPPPPGGDRTVTVPDTGAPAGSAKPAN